MTATLTEPTQVETALSPFLEELSAFDHFAVHIDKVPRILGSQYRLSWSDAGNLDSLEALVQDNELSRYDGYGWVTFPHTCIVCIDLDDCIDAEGNLSDRAVKVLETFPGAYVEYSTLGEGLHVWLKLDEPWEFGNKNKKTSHGFEIKSNMFVTLTGDPYPGSGDSLETYPLDTLKTWFERVTGEKLTAKAAPLDSTNREKPNKITVEELRKLLCDPDPKKAGIEADENAEILEESFLGSDPSTTVYNFLNRAAWFCPYEDVLWELIEPTGLYQRRKHDDAWWNREIAKAITKRKSYHGTERDNTALGIASGTRTRGGAASNPKSDEELLAKLFKSAKQFSEETPAEVDWVWQGYFPAGAAVELAGPVTRSGKTTLVTHACRAILDGRLFLNRQTKKTPIVYLTEQPEASFREALEAADLLKREDFFLMSWLDMKASGLSWPEAARLARLKAKQVGAKLLVIDTFNKIAGVQGDHGQSAGHMEGYLAPALESMADGVCVVFVRHDRKSGGEIGESGMGSTAVAGAMDVLLQLGRGDGNTHQNVRILRGLGRFRDTPENLTIELTETGYIEHGTITTVTAHKAEQAILETVPTGQENAIMQSLIVEELTKPVGESLKSKYARTTVTDAISELVKTGKLQTVRLPGRGGPRALYQAAS